MEVLLDPDSLKGCESGKVKMAENKQLPPTGTAWIDAYYIRRYKIRMILSPVWLKKFILYVRRNESLPHLTTFTQWKDILDDERNIYRGQPG